MIKSFSPRGHSPIFFGELHHLSKGAPPNPIFSANSSVRQFFTMPAPLFFMVTIEFFVSFSSLLSWRVLFGASTVNYEIHLLLGGCSNSRVPKSWEQASLQTSAHSLASTTSSSHPYIMGLSQLTCREFKTFSSEERSGWSGQQLGILEYRVPTVQKTHFILYGMQITYKCSQSSDAIISTIVRAVYFCEHLFRSF